MQQSFYWHDYETFGADPARDRPAQFAGQRTDMEFNPIGEPLVIYCKPSQDCLPHPESCLITGITPQIALQNGLIEAEFIRQINTELAKPGTCTLGYNSLRFDDEVTRYCLYRNFFDPYAREWQNGNSRWDIIDMTRLCYALRPEGIEWPRHDDGKPSFRLEDLSAANNLNHESAHDALSDVQATIELAKLINEKQPKLFNFLFNNRDKRKLAQQLNIIDKKPLLHTSAMYASEFGCTTLVIPIALHPTNRNSIIVYDLRYNPQAMLKLNAEEIQKRLFTKTEDLPEGIQRIPLKEIHINKSPVVAPIETLDSNSAKRIKLDVDQAMMFLDQLKASATLQSTIEQVYSRREFNKITDPDLSLYSGGFFNDEDRTRINQIRNSDAETLKDVKFQFDDPRLEEMLFRYRARNFTHTLNEEELTRWQEYCMERLSNKDGGGSLSLKEFDLYLEQCSQDPTLSEKQIRVLEDLAEYRSQFYF